VTIAFLDSGFFPHPDLTCPENRILHYHDVHDPGARLDSESPPDADDWHGTQTCVVAAGSGHLADGVYRGLAPQSRLVLVRVGRGGRISEADIAQGLEWVLANHESFGIRIVSMSVGGDEDRPLAESQVNQLAEEAVRRGLVLVAAAGNSGCTERHRSLPPATAPSVITVGGYDDGNDPERRKLALYCSSFGRTADGLIKPELLAPAMWVAAPILPGTDAYVRAEALARLAATPDNQLEPALRQIGPEQIGLPPSGTPGPDALRAWIDGLLREGRIVSAHYQHVDGTSFAAPVVASVVARMLEANPRLSPADVKRILLETAVRVGQLPAERQGYGVLEAKAAIAGARQEAHSSAATDPGGPSLENGRIVFSFHHDSAKNVALAGDLTGWRAVPMQPTESGHWRVTLPAPGSGTCRYKFVVDGRWVSDSSYASREPDPFGGWNSVFEAKPRSASRIE
jgi:serine protease AprX